MRGSFLDLSLEVAREAWNQGKTVILDPGPVRPLPPEFYPYCSVITPNETEAQALVGFPVRDKESASGAAKELLERGVAAVVVKLGSEGAFYATQNTMGFVPPFPVQALDSVAQIPSYFVLTYLPWMSPPTPAPA